MTDVIEDILSTKSLEDLKVESQPSNPTFPVLNETIVNQAIELLKEVGKNGGYGDIAKTIGFDKIVKSQVKQIHEKMLEKIRELNQLSGIVEE